MEPAFQKLSQVTSYSQEELSVLASNFKKLSSLRKTDGVIDRQEFRVMMNANPSLSSAFLDALFKLFDRDGNGQIDFVEFGMALAVYQNKATGISDADKQKLFFKLYDIDGDGEISQSDLATILRSCFASSCMQVADADIDSLIKATFAKYELTPRNTIDLASYCKLSLRL